MIDDIENQHLAVGLTLEKNVELARRIAGSIVDKNYVNMFVTGCSSSLFGGMMFKSAIEAYLHKPVSAVPASELPRYAPINKKDLVIAFSRSGETGDLVRAVEDCRKKMVDVVGVTASVGSSLGKKSDYLLFLQTGEEGFVTIKSYTASVAVSHLLALELAFLKGSISAKLYNSHKSKLLKAPELLSKNMKKMADETEEIAQDLKDSKFFLILGSGPNYPTALEGMLKLKECTYSHAVAINCNEFVHGYINALQDDAPVILIAPPFSPVFNDFEEIGRIIKRVKGKLITLGGGEKSILAGISDYFVEVNYYPEEIFTPLFYILFFQYFAFHSAIARNINPDLPAKQSSLMKKKIIDGIERVYL